MPTLRSRQVPTLPSKPSPRNRKGRMVNVDPPATPAQSTEPCTSQFTCSPSPTSKALNVTAPCSGSGSTRRRSLRLASKSASDGDRQENQELMVEEQTSVVSNERRRGKRKAGADVGASGSVGGERVSCSSLRPGKRVADRSVNEVQDKLESDGNGKRKLITEREINGESERVGDDAKSSSYRARRRFSMEEKGKEELADNDYTRCEHYEDFKVSIEVLALDATESVRDDTRTSSDSARGRFSTQERGKEKLADNDYAPCENAGNFKDLIEVPASDATESVRDDTKRSCDSAKGRFSREEKGKEKLANNNYAQCENADDFRDLVEVPASGAAKSVGEDAKRSSDGTRRSFSMEKKAKEKLADNDYAGCENVEDFKDSIGVQAPDATESVGDDLQRSSDRARRRFSLEEKGKEKLAENDYTRCETASDFKDSVELPAPDATESVDVSLQGERPGGSARKQPNSSRYQVFRDVARRNASRFAHFNAEEQGDGLVSENNTEVPTHEVPEEVIEDWPGPFSTAMKIIRDREKNMNKWQRLSSSEKAKPSFIDWSSKKDNGQKNSKKMPRSLQELCMRILVNNADAITSLEFVPETLKHKLCQMLCDSRKINCHFLCLLLRGSPTELRLKDCSWLTEDQFSKCFDSSDISCLTVLQLDQSGRCLADYILPSSLARSSNSLPALTTLSLTGACRLTDVGLRMLVSAAPRLRSINLSQCSLLTSAGLDALAAALGSVLQELYINDCQTIEPMLLLPSLKKLERLEVLSLAGIETTCDDFIREFVSVKGQHLKELNLMGCGKLTDSSVEVIAATCTNLLSLDLSNLSKLTDYALVYLANGCRELQALKLCRNAFSDEAVAAFLETSGELLNELLLNNIKKVGPNTALSIARRARGLHTLDLSFCRNVPDEGLGLIVDSCLSLRLLKLFGCSQVTRVFLNGHSNPNVQIIGLTMSPVLEQIKMPDPVEGPLRYSMVPTT